MITKLTIVIPTIRTDRGYLKQAVASVLDQSVACKLIIERTNETCAVNLQNGVNKVDTEFFAILADDDFLHERFAELMLKAIGKNDVCLCNSLQFDNDKSMIFKSSYSGLNALLRQNTIHGGSIIYRTSMAKGKYDTSLYCAEEYDLHLRLAQDAARFTHIDEALYYYRRHDGQKSKKGDDNAARRATQIALIRNKYR